jgi:hypothetical protein
MAKCSSGPGPCISNRVRDTACAVLRSSQHGSGWHGLALQRSDRGCCCSSCCGSAIWLDVSSTPLHLTLLITTYTRMLVILTLQVSQASILAFQQLVQLLPSARATAASKRAVDRLESQGSDDGILAALRLLAHTVAFWTPEALKRHVPRYISRWASHREFSVREVSVVALTSQPTAMRCSCGVGNIHDGENRLLFTAIVFFCSCSTRASGVGRVWCCACMLYTHGCLCVCV